MCFYSVRWNLWFPAETYKNFFNKVALTDEDGKSGRIDFLLLSSQIIQVVIFLLMASLSLMPNTILFLCKMWESVCCSLAESEILLMAEPHLHHLQTGWESKWAQMYFWIKI